jgi:hypothetical protein
MDGYFDSSKQLINGGVGIPVASFSMSKGYQDTEIELYDR